MPVKVLALSRSPKPALPASVRPEMAANTGDSITVDDARVLRNKHEQLGPAMPCYSVTAIGGRSYDYLPAAILSTKLRRDVEDTVPILLIDGGRSVLTFNDPRGQGTRLIDTVLVSKHGGVV